MIVVKGKILFADELYEYEEYEDGSKHIYKEKNSRGFKITINVSGDPEEHKAGIAAVKDFFVKGSM